MDTPDQLASLEGQQYLVLRPSGAVAEVYREIQETALDRLGIPARRPHTGHVTLRGFFEPERREELAALIRTWAAQQEPIEVSAEAVDVFPLPWQILIVRLARSASLVSAYSTLTATLDATDYRRLGELPLADWTFHLSVLYGKTLDAADWSRFAKAEVRPLSPAPTEVIAEAELVWYEDGIEYAEVLPLGG
ncbi:MAG: 2'-5' RNA ligase family protein [Microbacterium sp.]|nr:2'-5' RNA ligase family protein [Microbacterium sp.]MCV0376063.1 2'-5' RNA ligase family protein [Microbacterium sp.]MCV0390319.1 2'-5' RNA ligase family protein [Microbacterium sp.]MCV0418054.1 2'-5' RNA ligase family protein [Microbacterium sp.]MCV0422278.1 2'-5' RNA ligase family protein [Microbacterium sp.]